MFFGNSRVTIKRAENCDNFGITDKTFVVAFANGWVKDDIFLAYAKTCLDFEGWDNLVKLKYICMDNEFCSGLTGNPDGIDLNNFCPQNLEGLTGNDVYILENTFDNGSLITTLDPFCTLDANWHSNDCGCPPGYTRTNDDYDGLCFKIFPIESIGLDFTDEIDPCRFLLIGKQISDELEFVNTTANVFYKTYTEEGQETCNVATFQVKPDPCEDASVVCWPPGSEPDILIPTPDGELVTPCEYCEEYGSGGGDICYFESLAIASSTCECPYTATCYTGGYDPGNPTSSGNCFFSPGITTTEPCVNGSWNGASCADGYNDVCESTDCVDKICKELDWFIQNYAGYRGDPGGFLGYSSRITQQLDPALTGTPEEFFVSCGPTSVTGWDIGIFDEVGVTFGESASLRQWGRIVGLLNFFTHENGNDTGIIYDSELQSNSLNFNSIGGTSCGWFYPINLCCPPLPEGSFDYECPMCGPSGFTDHSPSEASCCCAKNMIPIVYGLNDELGFDEAATGISSIGLHPSQVK